MIKTQHGFRNQQTGAFLTIQEINKIFHDLKDMESNEERIKGYLKVMYGKNNLKYLSDVVEYFSVTVNQPEDDM